MSGDVLLVFSPNGMQAGTAYPVISFDLAKPGRGVVKLDKTRVVWEPLDWKTRFVSSTTIDNFKPPLTFLASLHRKVSGRKTETVANIKIDGGITDGSIDFSDELPVRKCRLEFDGTPGLYLVHSVELDVQDVRTGQKLTVKGDQPVFITVTKPE